MKKTEKKSSLAQINADQDPEAEQARYGADADKRGDNIRENQRLDPHKSAHIVWEAPEFEYTHKDVSWYWLSLMVAIILLAIALWQKNILFAVFVILGWFVIVNVAKQIPPIWEFRIDEAGIHLRNPSEKNHLGKTYMWQDLEGFSIFDGLVDHKQLVVKSKTRFSMFVKINFPEEKETEIETLCATFIPKEKYEESVVDHLARLIGF